MIHFVLNGVATGVWVVAIQTKVESNLLQIIFFALFEVKVEKLPDDFMPYIKNVEQELVAKNVIEKL